MHVLFVYPNLYTQMGFNHGLASLSAVLREAGHTTKLVNLNERLPPVPTRDEIYDQAKEAGLVGFSCLSMQYQEALSIARELRERAANDGLELPPFVVGGIHPTMVPQEVMADGAWDYVGVGECEHPLAELARRIEAGERPTDLPNFLAWKSWPIPAQPTPDDWITNPVGEFPDVHALPVADYELFDTQRIVEQKNGWFGILTGRGCPYRCTYCLNHKVVDRYREDLGRSTSGIGFLRYREASSVIDELRHVLDRYEGIGTFILDDDLFTMNSEHAIAFADAYREAGLETPWVVNSHVDRLEARVAEALASAHCRILKLGIEAGSERVRKSILKRFMSDDDILETVRVAEAAGLHTSGFVMVGLPGESLDERWATVDLLARSGLGRFRTSLFYPFPGTESHAYAIEGGWVSPEAAGSLTDFTTTSALDFGEEENLLVAKLAAAMPWFVNARLDGPAAARYAPEAKRVLAMDAREWEAFAPDVRDRDARLSAEATAADELHYAIRYNAFMGVRSDYFLAEEAGLEWATAAAKPVPAELTAKALAAAAGESC